MAVSFNADPFMRSIEGHIERYCAALRISREAVEKAYRLDSYMDYLADELAVKVTLQVYALSNEEARRVTLRQTFTVPKTWWDAFKLHFATRWWMRWIVKRWPVQFTELVAEKSEVVTARALLPDAPIRAGGHTVRFAMSGGEPWST
jgi:hypothetical protein